MGIMPAQDKIDWYEIRTNSLRHSRMEYVRARTSMDKHGLSTHRNAFAELAENSFPEIGEQLWRSERN